MAGSSLPATLAGGRYVLGEPLGQGGSAVVVRARDERLGVDRAVKILAQVPDSVRATMRRRLQAEARTMARLHHPHVLTVHDVGRDGDLDYVVMDFAPGGSVGDALDRRGWLPVDEAVDDVVQVLSALEAAHAAGVVHRDVKPGNLLLDAAGRVLLADFGVALIAGEDRRTRAGAAIGSF
ncbi:MAG: serine/threonine-protein kinase, partial [Myxococcota bacterium]